MEEFLSSEIFKWVLMPLIIFFARILDVSLGTTRIIMISKGKKELAMLIGFFEVTIWLLVAGKVIQSVDNILYVIAYAGGFAAGSYIGVVIDEKLAIGTVATRIITLVDPTELIKKLSESGFGVTKVEATGSRGNAHIIYSIMHRKKLHEFEEIAKKYVPKAFISVEDIRSVKDGVFHPMDTISFRKAPPTRKSK
ncbi:DUF2179 domain-containing protein [Oceanotoga sp. DSM 15011]|uniref:DUF2179 domain-containing protein n=1 Tax=Oceanotoga sp. DSM 15011 TaxID=2984951 RepID=UPI0021F40E65|nr:DUF2179 domain-containing protein [Oceanotoga sp. DSM 15011]UYO99328.1 DUF2179 domain-containing protein [Oceanotoga sp. DSM 15011]